MLVLIGYRGTGKTTVARLLAARLAWAWADLDDEIEHQASKSIAAIFAEEGEPAFRDMESQQLARHAEQDRLVLAAGGGVVLRPENREILHRVSRRGGRVIWLQAKPETICERVAGDASTNTRRPNLTTVGGLNEIVQLLEQRAPLYAQCADAAIDTEGKGVEQVVQEIVDLLRATSADRTA
jgi:shikimate kinase